MQIIINHKHKDPKVRVVRFVIQISEFKSAEQRTYNNTAKNNHGQAVHNYPITKQRTLLRPSHTLALCYKFCDFIASSEGSLSCDK